MNTLTKTHARLTKLVGLPGGIVEPFGARGAGPIVEGYEVKGYFDNLPTVGHPFLMARYESNGVRVPGIFTTSPVAKVEEDEKGVTFETHNSKYRLEYL